LNERWLLQHREFPRWFFYPIELYELHLSALTFEILAQSARLLHLSYKGKKKGNVVSAIAAHAFQIHVRLVGMSHQELREVLQSDEGPLIPVLSSYFENLFGSDVAAALRRPPCPIYSINECPEQLPQWATALSRDDSVRRLNTLEFELIVECI